MALQNGALAAAYGSVARELTPMIDRARTKLGFAAFFEIPTN